MNQSRRSPVIALCFAVLFLVMLALTLLCDVQPISPEGKNMGMAALNKSVFDRLGQSDSFYKISKYAGYLSILAMLLIPLYGVIRFVKEKKVPRFVLWGVVTIAVMLVLYVLFEKIYVSYRPVLIDGQLEASFPSTHATMSVTAAGLLFTALPLMCKNSKVVTAGRVLMILLAVLVAVTRLLSGVHWFTDILSGMILGLALTFFYRSLR